MNIIKSNGRYTIIQGDATLGTFLPTGIYKVGFDGETHSHFLTEDRTPPLDERIYGNTEARVDKCLKSFQAVDRSLGVILSGPKGSGKTVFAKMLCAKGLDAGLPFIIVDRCTPGLERFITSIEQPCIVFFDEFEKMFSGGDEDCYDDGPQARLLPMFDGMMNNDKLFVIAVNNIRRLNDCLINRPGRFHYNFMFDNPDRDSIRQYIQDKIKPEYANLIDSLVSVSTVGRFSYDCLRAILFDINQGYGIEETLGDINVRMNLETEYELVIKDNYGHTFYDSVCLRPELFMDQNAKQLLKFVFSCYYGDFCDDIGLEATISNVTNPNHIDVPAGAIDAWYMPETEKDGNGQGANVIITDVYLVPRRRRTDLTSPVHTLKQLNKEASIEPRLSIKVRHLTDKELKERNHPPRELSRETVPVPVEEDACFDCGDCGD